MGWQGTVLRVDLSAGTARAEPLRRDWAEAYIGGRGLAAKYLAAETDARIDALSPANKLIFATGPLTGTDACSAARYVATAKSPLTGTIGAANSGGFFGAELKFAGYDLVIVEGRSPRPVYLLIEDDVARILPADAIWGKTVWQADAWLKETHADPLIRVAAVGPAGEAGVRYAAVINDLHRAAGRSGMGAVMGSKNLKAIAVRGTKGVRAAEPERFAALARSANAKVAADPGTRSFAKNGTIAMVASMQAFGGLPTRNFREVSFEGAGRIDADAVRATGPDGHRNLVTNRSCFACTIACGRVAHVNPNHFSVAERPEYRIASGGLEYETAFALGSALGIDDLDALTFAGFLANAYGFDPISFGVTLAAAMELFEVGAITEKDTDGVALRFGDAHALVVMAEKTGKGEGFGRALGEGSKRLCERYGRPDLSMSVKGQEFAGYDARAMQGMGLGFATSNRGACHLKHDTFAEDRADRGAKGKAKACKESQDVVAFKDSTGLCLFVDAGFDVSDIAHLIDAALAGDWSAERLVEAGERIWNLERLYNLAAGFTAADDTLPPRLLKDPVPTGKSKGRVAELATMLPEYYRLRGWDEAGRPTAETLRRLGLGT